MNEGWTTRWKALFLWLCGYLSIIAFALTGGYVIVKSENEELKKTAKNILIVTLIFTAVSMFLTVFNAIGSMADSYYSSDAYAAYNIMSQIITLAKVLVYAICGAVTFFKKEYGTEHSTNDQKKEEISNEQEPKA